MIGNEVIRVTGFARDVVFSTIVVLVFAPWTDETFGGLVTFHVCVKEKKSQDYVYILK